MLSLILDWAVFFLVLFVVIPGLMSVAILIRDILAQNRHPNLWHKGQTRKFPG